MSAKVKPIPEGYRTVTPCLVVEDAAEAIEFYKAALGAKEICRFEGPDGRLIHAEIQVGDSRLMLGCGCPESGCLPPSELHATTCSLYLYVPDADEAFHRAVDAGAEAEADPEDTFWGDRMGLVSDPYGHRWLLATHREDLSETQMRQRAEEFFASKAAVH